MRTPAVPATATTVTAAAIAEAVTAAVVPLNVPDDLFNTDGIAVPIIQGLRCDGQWHVGILGGPPDRSTFLGKIIIGAGYSPDRVLEIAFAWAHQQCAAAGWRIIRTVSDKQRLQPGERSHLVLGRILIVGKDWS